MWVCACPPAAPPCVPACLFLWMVLVFVSLVFTSNRHLYEGQRRHRKQWITDFTRVRVVALFSLPIFRRKLEEDADHNGLRNVITFFLVSVYRPLCSPPLPPPYTLPHLPHPPFLINYYLDFTGNDNYPAAAWAKSGCTSCASTSKAHYAGILLLRHTTDIKGARLWSFPMADVSKSNLS